MIQSPEIKPIAFYAGKRKVSRRDEADLVSIKVSRGKMVDFYHLHKCDYDSDRTFEKPVAKWSQLPETV